MSLLAGVVGVALAGAPSPQTLVYYNARMALREGQADEAVRLWLLRNSLGSATGHVSSHDPDFRSVTWAALGELGLCQDGLAADDDGAGLWPLALHNWIVTNAGRRLRGSRPRPWDAFQIGQQQRFVALGDVLSARELEGVALSRGPCARQRLALVSAALPITADLKDRSTQAAVLVHLIEKATTTLGEHVVGRSVLEARRFDLHLQRTAIAEREARQRARDRVTTGRGLGMPRATVEAVRSDQPTMLLDRGSEAARILEAAPDWSVDEWMALEPERRRYLFDRSKDWTGSPRLDRVAEGVVDRLIASGDGAELTRWLARRATPDDLAGQRTLTEGSRGAALLALGPDQGFDERAVIALHRGVAAVAEGDLDNGLRAFAAAMADAPTSAASDTVGPLARRWLSYVAARFVLDEELLATLEALLPRRAFQETLEDLLWRAALRADTASFERGLQRDLGRSALSRRLQQLEPLARGDLGLFLTRQRDGLRRSPSETLRFLDSFLDQLERDEAEVRAAHRPTLQALGPLLGDVAEDPDSGRIGRQAAAAQGRVDALLDGLEVLGETTHDRARAVDPDAEVFIGSVRLAPADPLPWPFRVDPSAAPSAFVPLTLVPVEWRSSDGERVYGWEIRG